MKNGLTPELLEQAKTAASAAELLALAAENGIELTPAEAASYYLKLHPQSGALPDEELDNVAGGGCHNQTDGRLIVTGLYVCDYWICRHCHLPRSGHYYPSVNSFSCRDSSMPDTSPYCQDCMHRSKEGAVMYCNHPANHKSNNP